MVDKAYLPDIAIFLNPTENMSGIRECTLRNIPTVGIVDSDTDPRIVTYPIPANMEVSPCLPVPPCLVADGLWPEPPNGGADTWDNEYCRAGRTEITA